MTLKNKDIKKKNKDIREYSKEKRVYLYEVSERLGYTYETAFSRVLRHELSKNEKTKIMAIIDELAAEQK